MYSGKQKFGRGGGRGGGATKRNVFGAPPPQRLSQSSTSGRLSLGGSRNPPPSSATAPASVISTEETFSLVGGDPLSFAALIRLAPDLVDEIKRVEAQGGAAKIKFDSNPKNPLGNVIDVGGKEFRFTWSHETGGLCDIYEERQSAEDGNGLLVESGCAWRKLNVQRVLDESAKNHVKRLSEEAERQFKSRKAKFLDPSSANMKSQMRALVAAEASPWKQKKEFFKKKNFEPPQVVGPTKSVHKSGFPSTGTARGRHSASPIPSPQNQSVSLASPSMRRNVTESQAMREDTAHIQAKTRENAMSVEKDLTPRSFDRMQGASSRRENQVEGAKDVLNLLITLLKENPKGMSIKTLEKAVADRISYSARKIEPLLKKIANFEHPGMYILKPGVESESQTRLSFDSGSSPEGNQQKQLFPENIGPAPVSDFPVKSPPEDLEEQVPMNELNSVEKIDHSQHFSALFGDDEIPDNNEGQAASSRDSGSDSDSDSSDSGSDSGSQSRSRSPVGTASGSGSDSEKDSSSNSKEGSDVEIDILNDDDNEPKKLHDAEHGLSKTTVPWSIRETGPSLDGNLVDQDGYASEDIDIEKDFLGDNETELASVSHAPTRSAEKLKIVSPDHDQSQLYGVTDVRNEPEDVEEFKHEHPDSLMRLKGTSKRGSDEFQFEENPEHLKRFKAGSMAQSSISGYIGGSSPRSSPDITNEDHEDNHNLQMPDSFDRNDNSNFGIQRGYNYPVTGKLAQEFLQSGRRPPVQSHDIETADKFGKNARNRGSDGKHQEANAYKRDGYLKQGDKGRRETRDGEFGLNDKVNGKFKEGAFDKKQDSQVEANYEKHNEEGKKSHAVGNLSRQQQLGSSPKDGGQADFERASVDRRRLHREFSDLELGELREPLPDEPDITKKYERVGSFKQSDTKSNTSGSQNADLRGKLAGKSILDTGSPSIPNSRAGGPKNSDNWSKKRSPEHSADDNSRPSHRTLQSQQQQQSKVARAEVGSLIKAADANRLRHNEDAVNQGTDVEGYGESQKKSNVGTQLEESKQELGSRKAKGNKSLKSNPVTDAIDRRKDASSTEGRNDKRKRSASSLDEDISYSKFEKEEPELKGPIKSFSQYKEYVQEYCEKYESYHSLNKILETFRNEFQKLGTDLNNAKGRDMELYHTVLTQLRERYHQCGMRHKRLKKIFIVLHEELKHLKQMIKDFAVENLRIEANH